MNAFNQTRMVEASGMARLRPFIEEHSNGQFVLIEKGPLAAELQQTIGDVLMNHKARGRLVSIELKSEQQTRPNFFLETWSNRDLDDAASWEARGSNVGWMYKIHATLLFYHFLDEDRLYIIKMFDLARWAFNTPSQSLGAYGATRIHDFKLKEQGKYAQKNDTWGHCVPIAVIRDEVGFVFDRVLQRDLWPSAAA